ncbi:MAG: DUF2378 family protein [Deltaproteobacteria bacterium]|nr:DUF2378 family protein [Deltaproteobacteria bacterium]
MQQFLLVALAAWIFFSVVHVASSHVRASVIHVAAALLTGLLLVTLRARAANAGVTAQLGLGVTALAFFSDSMISGQLDAAALFWVCLLPLAASYVASRRFALLWLFAAISLVGTMAVVSFVAPIKPEYTERGLGVVPSLAGLALCVYLVARAGRRAFDGELSRASTLAERVQAHAVEADRAKEQAMTLARLKDGLIANTSHELRTPLNGILGTLTLLELSELEDRQRDLVDNAKASAEHLASLLADILDLSAMQAGALRLAPAATDARDVLEDVMDVVATRAAEKGLDLSLVIPSDAPLVMLDPVRLRQIVLNVVGNAVKFTDTGAVGVQLRYRGREDRVEVMVVVEDTGPGMSEAQLARLFRPFEQGDPLRPRHVEGSGLGLAVSQRLAKALGGGIEVKSQLGKGTTFTIDIVVPSGGAPTKQLTPFGSTHVVVLEPSDRVRVSIMSSLACLGCSTAGAKNAEEARGLLGEKTDAIVLGPAISVDHAEEIIRELDAPASTRVIALLVHLRGARASSAGPVRVVVAPARRKRLAAALSRALGGEVDAVKKVSMTGPKLRVLVVDDSSVNRLVCAGLLEALGHRADGANSGAEALGLIGRKDYDAVLLDLSMPGMSGFELLRRIRALRPDDRCPFLVVSSASVDPATRQAVREARADDFLAKPIRMEALEQLLSRVTLKTGATALTRPITTVPRVPATPVLDLAIFGDLEALFVDPTDLASTCQTFIDSLLALLEWLQTPAADDTSALRMRAHTIRGSGGTLGASRLSQVASEIELSILNGRGPEALALRPELAKQTLAAIAAIKERLEPFEPRLDEPFDLESEVLHVPEESTCKGVLFQTILALIPETQRGTSEVEDALRAARVYDGPYHALATYPLRDLFRLSECVVRLTLREVPTQRGLATLATHLFPALAVSLAGRPIFGVLGTELDTVVAHLPKTRAAAISLGAMEIVRTGPESLRIVVREFPTSLISFEIGFVTGALAAADIERPNIKVLPNRDGFVMNVSWAQTAAQA